MATPLSELLPQIVTLNVPDQPFSVYAQGTQITGWWDIAKVTSLCPTQVTHADESYRLTIASFPLPETSATCTWDFTKAVRLCDLYV